MLIARYAKLVGETDQFKDRSTPDRRRISILGLVSEIGSVISAVKKQRLGEGGPRDATEGLLTRHELHEELGDVMWYCFALAALEEKVADDILGQQLDSLRRQLDGEDTRSLLFKDLLKQDNLDEFRKRAAAFPSKRQRTFRHFQDTAILTARTGSAQLVEISLAVLMQLGAQLMRHLLPEAEQRIHNELEDVTPFEILGRIAWHLAAIATVYGICLNDVAKENISKAQLRRPKTLPTPLHDADRPDVQKFPRQFEIKFLTVGKGVSRMYLKGRQLGDDLNDNSYDPDGYRFHDVLHLANVAHLGWSPVIRSLMQRKRKDDKNPKLDEVEDGARARIVEEAILKVVHSEGSDIAAIVHPDLPPEQRPLFSDEIDIPLSFFKLIRRYVRGLEVEENSFEEWKSAIRDGYRIYKKLVDEGQGTVNVDLDSRTITFKPEVYVDLAGPVAGVGSFTMSLDTFDPAAQKEARAALTAEERVSIPSADNKSLAINLATKRAVLQSLGLGAPTSDQLSAIALTSMGPGKFSVKTSPPLQQLMWERAVVTFKTSVAHTQNNVYCTALAISQPRME